MCCTPRRGVIHRTAVAARSASLSDSLAINVYRMSQNSFGVLMSSANSRAWNRRNVRWQSNGGLAGRLVYVPSLSVSQSVSSIMINH